MELFKNHKRWVYCLLASASVIFYFLLFSTRNAEEALFDRIRHIPKEDRWILEDFFRTLLLKEGGAYTLFGNKPMTYDAYFESLKDEIPSFITSRKLWEENKRCQMGWKAWEKYQHLFPSKKFLLIAKHRNENWVEIILANKEHLTQKIKEHLSEFKAILGDRFAPECFLNEYEKGNDSLFHLLKEHHGLFGILLGFGKRNAWMYQERDRIFVDFYHFTLKIYPHPSSQFKTIDEEKHYFENTLTRVFKEDGAKCFTYIHLPYFMADLNSTETHELRRKYLQARRHIQNIYFHGDFLEITLRKFCMN